MTCKGFDRHGDLCSYESYGQEYCYFHEGVSTGRLTDYYTSAGGRGIVNPRGLTPLLSGPRGFQVKRSK